MAIPLAAVQRPLSELCLRASRPLVEWRVRQLMDSIRHDGQFNPITIRSNGEIIDGGHRYEAARRLGWKYMIVRIDDNFVPVDIQEGIQLP